MCVTCPAAAGESEGASPLVAHVEQEDTCKMLHALALRHCRGTSKRQMHTKACIASVKMLCTVVYALIHTSLVVVVWCCVIGTLCVDDCVMFTLHVSPVVVVWCCVIFTLCIDACTMFTLRTVTKCLNTLCIDARVMFTLCTFGTCLNIQLNENI